MDDPKIYLGLTYRDGIYSFLEHAQAHPLYKQVDIQLNRLSNIQQDVFISYRSQILFDVCLHSSLIGQNCTIDKKIKIENSIIYDNGLIRNSVQIDKERILGKNVIIGTNVHLNQRMTMIASNSITSTTVIHEIEIDDDIEISSENVKHSNFKQRSNSISSSEKFISSSNGEIMISNSDLVGVDGFGKELIFNSVYDDQAENFEHKDDDDKNQLNVSDAWCYRIERRENRCSSVILNEDFQEAVILSKENIAFRKIKLLEDININYGSNNTIYIKKNI
ncbi:unnamed protein product [Rotaria sordida]|uniref:EIF2B subunit epsilon/gamma LbH domain-containing protein n=1 Tax=Rotaria sordida TaxID=392033 RepID=A0A815D7M9_9BILA|nr:unnamed protein product [Rotaria sordida]CAF1569371.1 unnamed protein product [Rotaria sordida]